MLSVVVPCRDEAGNIARIETELFPVLEGIEEFELIAVDDGSTDATAGALAELAQRRQELRLFKHGSNNGLGAALKTGLAASKGDWIVFLDADLTFHPSYIPKLLEEQKKTDADCVSGSPFKGGMMGVPLTRQFPSRMLNAFYRGLFNWRLTSYTPMFRLYRRSDLATMNIKSDGFEISVEILVHLLRRRRKVVEVPVPLTVRTAGTSKLRRFRELLKHARLTAGLLFLR